MPARNSSEMERRGVPLDANRARTRHPKHSGRQAVKSRSAFAERNTVRGDCDVLERPSRALTGWLATGAGVGGQEGAL